MTTKLIFKQFLINSLFILLWPVTGILFGLQNVFRALKVFGFVMVSLFFQMPNLIRDEILTNPFSPLNVNAGVRLDSERHPFYLGFDGPIPWLSITCLYEGLALVAAIVVVWSKARCIKSRGRC